MVLQKKDLLRMLQEANQKKIQFEQGLNKASNQVNILRENYLKHLGQMEMITKLLSEFDAHPPQPLKAQKAAKPQQKSKVK